MIAALTANELVWRFGWMLLHSLWQIALMGFVLWVILRITQHRSAKLRYGISCAGLAACYLPLLLTFSMAVPASVDSSIGKSSVLLRDSVVIPQGPETESALIAESEAAQRGYFSLPENDPTVDTEGVLPFPITAPPGPSSQRDQFQSELTPWIAWLVGGWLAGVCLLAIWNVGGWMLVQRLRRQGIPLASDLVIEKANLLLERMQIRQTVKLLESVMVEVPVVIGWLKPVILLPAGLLMSLTPEQLEAVIAHELAHIRRHDYLVNLLQTLTESLLFYHPVVWWLSHRIRVEREFCCDDEAIAASGDRNRYVTAVETARLAPAHALSLAGSRDGSTLSRMRRLMGATPAGSQGWIAGLSSIVLLLCLGLTVGFSQPSEPPEESNTLNQQHRVESEVSPATSEPSATKPADGSSVPFPETFQLDLTYHGESDKPFYKYSLRNNLKASERDGIHLVESADFWQDMDRLSWQALDWLHRSGFFQHAQEIDQGVSDPAESTSQGYLLRVKLGNRVWVEDLGFDLGTLLRLESLQKLLTSVELKSPRDPDKPLGLELLLSRLSGYKQIWMEGQLDSDLKLQVSSDQNQYLAGTAVPVKVELKNAGTQPATCEQHILSLVPSSIYIYDEYGRRVPYVGGTSQIQSHVESLAPGATVTLDQFDLAAFNYLRRPGHYLMYAVHGNGIRSNNFEFDLISNPELTTDFVGPLLPLVREDWMLVANPNFAGEIHPGRNFSKVAGFPVRFQCSPTGSIRDVSHVWLYFTKEQAQPLENPIEEYFLPETTYAGQIGKYHLYAYVDEKSQQRWPEAIDQVREAIRQQRVDQQLSMPPLDLIPERKTDSISLLIRQLDESHGLWMNGTFAPIELPATANPGEVLAEAVKKYGFDKGHIEKYKVREVRKGLKLSGALPQADYCAVRIESEQGDKILLMRFEPGLNAWWSRFYDPPQPSAENVHWGKPDRGIQLALGAKQAEWAVNETPALQLRIRNSSEKAVTFIPHISVCRVEYDGTWYVWGSPAAWGGPAVLVPPGETKDTAISFKLVHDDPQGWITESGQKPLELKPGKHSLRVLLSCNEGQAPVSQALEITITAAVTHEPEG